MFLAVNNADIHVIESVKREGAANCCLPLVVPLGLGWYSGSVLFISGLCWWGLFLYKKMYKIAPITFPWGIVERIKKGPTG